MHIGFTERGDAGLDFSWVSQVEDQKSIRGNHLDGTILITKRMNQRFVDEVLRLHKMGRKIIVHCGCTGWGGTWLEPNVPTPDIQLGFLGQLITSGFPATQCVLRIDPIIPCQEGLDAVKRVFSEAYKIKIPYEQINNCYCNYSSLVYSEYVMVPSGEYFIEQPIRCRISIYDEYKHVKNRLRKLGHEPFYGNNRFYANNDETIQVLETLAKLTPDSGTVGNNFTIETCAEKTLVNIHNSRKTLGKKILSESHPWTKMSKKQDAITEYYLFGPNIIANGCLSKTDIEILGIDTSTMPKSVNGQNRFGCLCLTCKEELLTHKHPCPNNCVYCYWQD